MTNETLDALIKSKLSEKRYRHTLAVEKLSTELAAHYGVSVEDAHLAAMLHDITKEEPIDIQLQIIENSDIMKNTVFMGGKYIEMFDDKECNIPTSESLLQGTKANSERKRNIRNLSPNIYHAVTAFLFARDVLLIQNEDVLHAIRYHTTGRFGMSMLEKIIFTADTVSYDRAYEDVKRLRLLSFQNLDGCMLEISAFIIADLVKKKAEIHMDTVKCYHALCKKNEESANEE